MSGRLCALPSVSSLCSVSPFERCTERRVQLQVGARREATSVFERKAGRTDELRLEYAWMYAYAYVLEPS